MKELFGSTMPSVIENPFSKDCITNVSMRASKSLVYETFYFRGSVEFKKGNTTGEQKFEADSFDELYIKIANFCKTL